MKQDFLNPKFLRYFVSVAELGSFIAASKELNISQPSLSRSIQILEANLKKQLFLRSKKGAELTKEGELLYLNAKAIIKYNEKVFTNLVEHEIQEKKALREYVNFGLPQSLSSSHKENLLWILKKNNPNKKIRIVEEESNKINNMVYEKKLDYAVSCVPEFKKELTKINLYEDPFCVGFYKGHEFQKMKNISLDRVRSEPNYIFRKSCEFFYYNYRSTHKGPVDYKIINKGIEERVKNGKHKDVIYTSSETTAAHCIKAGLGIAIIPESVAIDYKLLFRELTTPSLSRSIYFIYREDNKHSVNLEIDMLKNALWL